jgi:hypothetical protein
MFVTSFEPTVIPFTWASFLTPDWYCVMVLGSVSELKTTAFFPIAVFCSSYIKIYKTMCSCPAVILLSVAPTAFNHHVLVLLEDHIWLIEKIEHGYWWQLCRSTARLWYLWRIHEMHQCLNNCMICGIHVSIQWKVTFPTAVKGIVPIWCYDPVLQRTNSSYR